VAGQSISAM